MAIINSPQLDINENFPRVNCVDGFPSDFVNRLSSYKRDSFSLISFNVRSCRRNMSCFLSFLSTLMFNFTLIILYETWLTSDIDYGFDIEGYNQLNVYRDCFGGGLKIFCDERYGIKSLNDFTFMADAVEILTVLITADNFRCVICCIYRPPNSNPYMFFDILFRQVLSKFSVSDRIMIVGDVNLNLFNPNNFRHIDEFINEMYSFNFFSYYYKTY